MDRYYSEKLAAERLKACYEIAPQRVQQYLRAEIDHVLTYIEKTDLVVELGCGYGRVLATIAGAARWTVGIDNAPASLRLARDFIRESDNCDVVCMDAVQMGFRDGTFDRVVCIQNGISAFHVDRKTLMAEAIRITRPGGTLLFSTYSSEFWNHRLDWFERQAEAGLIGEIDREKTGEGRIVCRDGFTATTVSPDEFMSLVRDLAVEAKLIEVDGSSLFCVMTPTG